MKTFRAAAVVALLAAWASFASADPFYDRIYAEFPRDAYLVGIGEVPKSGNALKDRRTSEILARADLAKQIKVRVREETTDLMCERSGSKVFKDKAECRNEIISVVETSVDEFLEGSRIARHEDRDSVHLAVAVIEKRPLAAELEKKSGEAVEKAKEEVKKARQGSSGSAKKAQEEYLKAVTYSKEKEALEGVKGRANAAFESLEKELGKLEERQ